MNRSTEFGHDAYLIEKRVVIQSLQEGVFYGDEHHIPSLAPPLPRHPFIGRTQILEHIKQRLFAGETLAFTGLPGIGKTTLTLAVAHDGDILEHFGDGILWAALGKTPDLFDIFERWLSALGIPAPLIQAQKTLEQRIQCTKQAISDRHMLLIIDDSWDTTDSNLLKVGGVNCVYLLTTRQPQIALDFAESGSFEITRLTLEDSLTLLTAVAENIKAEENDTAKELVNVVDCLPLALILVGKYLRNTDYHERPDRIRLLIEQVQHRINLSQQKDFRKQAPDIPGASISLQAVISTTYEALDLLSQTTLRALAVFAAEPATFSMDAALAVTESPGQALRQLFEYGILMSGEWNRWQIHQTISDYAALKLGEDLKEEQNSLYRHSTYFAEFLEHREIQLEYKIPKEPLTEIKMEMPNIRLMWERSLEQQQEEIVQKASNGLQIYYLLFGQHQEGEKAFGRAVTAFEERGDAQYSLASCLLAARMTLFQGRFLQSLGQHKNHERIEQLYKQALQMQAVGIMAVCRDMTVSLNKLEVSSHRLEQRYSQTLQICQKMIGRGYSDGAMPFNELVRLYHHRERKQLEHFVLQAIEAEQEQDPTDPGILPEQLATLCTRQEEHEDIRQHCTQESLERLESVFGEMSPYMLKLRHDMHGITLKLSDGLQIFSYLWEDYCAAEKTSGQDEAASESERTKQYQLCSILLAARILLLAGTSERQNDRASEFYHRSLKMQMAGLRAVYQDITTSLKNLATFYEIQGRYSESAEYYNQILRVRRHVLGPGHPDFATSLIDLARLYHTIGQYPEAEQLFLESLNILQTKTGPDLATLYNNLAALYKSQGRYEEAETYYRKSFDLWETVLGSENPYLATLKNNLGGLYQAEGKYAEAETLYQEALEMRRKLFGQEHLDVAQSLHNLAGLRLSQGREPEAEALYQESLQIRERFLGPKHPDLAVSCNNLADLYRLQGKYAEAESLYKRSLGILENVFGSEHHIAIVLDNLALIYHFQGRYFEALPLYQQSLETRKRILGQEHPEVAQSLNNLARLYYSLGRYPEAEKRFLESLSIQEKSVEVNHPDTAFLLSNIAEVYRAQGKHAQANQFDQRALTIAESLKHAAKQHELQQEYADAETLYYQSLKIKELMLGEGHLEVAELRQCINDLAKK